MPKIKVDKKEWSIAAAMLAIDDYLIIHPRSSAVRELQTLYKKLQAVLDKVQSTETYDVNFSTAEQIRNLNSSLKSNIEAITEDILLLYQELALLSGLKTKDNQEEFSYLIQKIILCLNGTLNQFDSFLNAKKPAYRYNFLYYISDKLGVKVKPWAQNADPFIGKMANETNKYAPAMGHCFGDVLAWLEEIRTNGFATGVYHLNDNILYEQKHQYKKLIRISQMGGCLSPTYPLQYNIGFKIASISDDQLFCLTIRGINIHHILGIRRLPGSNCIELFDPNFGLFYFKDEDHFNEWFPFLIHTYSVIGSYPDEFKLYSFGSQSNTATSILANNSLKNNFVLSDVNDTKRILLSLAKVMVHGADSNNDAFRASFYLAFKNIIGRINDMSMLDEIKTFIETHEKFKFIFTYQSMLPTFFAKYIEQKNGDTRDWSANVTACTIAKLFQIRAEYLQSTSSQKLTP